MSFRNPIPDTDNPGTFQADFDEGQPNSQRAQKTIAGLAGSTFAAIIVICVLSLILVPLVTVCILKKRQKRGLKKRIDAELAAAANIPASVAVPAAARSQGAVSGPAYPAAETRSQGVDKQG